MCLRGICAQFKTQEMMRRRTLMKKRFKFLSILTAGAVACTVTLAGCSLVSADSQADMEQVIATVDITKSESLDSSLTAYTGAKAAALRL